MKPKPKPSKELIVIRCPRHIHFTTYSKDAEIFVLTEALNYGTVEKLNNNIISLCIQSGYDLDEVADYFESYND